MVENAKRSATVETAEIGLQTHAARAAREARLQSVRDNQAQRLSVDTHAVREARLQSVRDTEVVCGDSCCWLGKQDFRF